MPGRDQHLVRFRAKDWLGRVFEVGIVLKGIDGIFEMVGGVLLVLFSPAQLSGVVRTLTQHELSTDPDDIVATQLLHTVESFTGNGLLFAAVYLLLHGLVKVVLVLALLRNKVWAYPWLIGVLLTFIGYQVYRIARTPSPVLMVLTAFDVIIVALTWREYRRVRKSALRRAESPASWNAHDRFRCQA
jgi:uncharacterized membrane protein